MFYEWPHCPKKVRVQVEQIQVGLVAALRGNLVGIYLHGSLAMGCFNPALSDIDLLAVAEHTVSERARQQVVKLFLEISADPCPIECSILLQRDLNSWRHPAAYEFHYSESWRKRFSKGYSVAESRGVDTDLAAHVSVTRARGIRLSGLQISRVFPEVPKGDYVDSAIADYRWARRRINRRVLEPAREIYCRLYFVLNASRVWSLLETGNVLSKAEAARWAQPRLPPNLRGLATSALQLYRTGRGTDFATYSRSLSPFIGFIETRLNRLV